jgi:hypothetical protein
MNAAKFVFVGFERDGTEVEYSLPGKFEVCHRCEGSGTHVNPSIDGNGISPEEFAEDPDFEESYFRGDYDVQCSMCKGARVVAEPDVTRWTFAQKRAYVTHLKSLREMERDDASEAWLRRAESGECW